MVIFWKSTIHHLQALPSNEKEAIAEVERKKHPHQTTNRRMNSQILIYQHHDGDIKMEVRLEEESVWLTQAQMAALFGKNKRIFMQG